MNKRFNRKEKQAGLSSERLALLTIFLLGSGILPLGCKKKSNTPAVTAVVSADLAPEIAVSKAADEKSLAEPTTKSIPKSTMPVTGDKSAGTTSPKTPSTTAQPASSPAPLPPPISPPPPNIPMQLSGRDPFASYFDELARAEEKLPKANPLLRFDLKDLRFVGVIREGSALIALLEDPLGEGHSVRIGSHIGKNNGQVTSIKDSIIIIKETRKDSSHHVHISYATLVLNR